VLCPFFVPAIWDVFVDRGFTRRMELQTRADLIAGARGFWISRLLKKSVYTAMET
jgi:hypothetical protein